jgi:hypothetical protein
MPRIDSFSGRYRFLSNFWPTPLRGPAGNVLTVEHQFQAAKCTNTADYLSVLSATTPGEAKHLGRAVRLRADWDKVSYNVMQSLVVAKFTDPDLAARLAGTWPARLIEGNTWHDNQWGVCFCGRCDGVGGNDLGRILENVREMTYGALVRSQMGGGS